MCYQGSAEFDPLGATATWQELDIAGTSGWGAEYDPNQADTTTRFDSDRTTTTELTEGDSFTHAVDIRTDRAYFTISGIDPNPENTYDYFAVAPPFAGGDGDTVPARSALACEPESSLTGSTPTPTPLETVTGNGDSGDKTPPPTQTPFAQEFNVLGTCEVPTQNGTKTGLSVEYYDAEYDAEYLTFNLTYNGTSVDKTIEFDRPKGYYVGCHAAGTNGVDPGNVGETVPNGTGPGIGPNGTIQPPTVNGTTGNADGSSETWNASGFGGLNAGLGGGDDGAVFGPTGSPGGGGGSPLLGFGLVAAGAYAAARATGRAPSVSQTAQQASQAARNVVRRVR
jgi:hypothetical protein